MSNIRLLAIEDEPIYAESLRLIIEELGYILIEVTDDVREFQRLVKATIPDILLIDIDLGVEIDGIQLAEMVSDFSAAPVIFLTASKDLETITRAKSARPSAYIPKPYEASTLQAAIELAVMNGKTSDQIGTKHSDDSFFVKSEGVLKKVNIREIRFLEVREKYCYVFTTRGEVEVKMRLKDLLAQLPNKEVIQIHRSFAVMKRHIDSVGAGLNTVRVGETELPVGKNYREALNLFLKKIG